MAKKILKITIEVDMDCPSAKVWKNPEQFFESEVDGILQDIAEFGRDFNYVGRSGESTCGTKWKLSARKQRKKLTNTTHL